MGPGLQTALGRLCPKHGPGGASWKPQPGGQLSHPSFGGLGGYLHVFQYRKPTGGNLPELHFLRVCYGEPGTNTLVWGPPGGPARPSHPPWPARSQPESPAVAARRWGEEATGLKLLARVPPGPGAGRD